MKISIDDIEIIETPIKEKSSNDGIEDYMKDKEQVVVRSTRDNIRRICYVTKGTRPPFKKLFENQRSVYDNDFLMTMYYER
jgi:hypothetical protein